MSVSDLTRIESGSPSPFGSRRSYPALNPGSLAPLTPLFPIDDVATSDSANSRRYSALFSTMFVPNSPGAGSHSRSASQHFHHGHRRSSGRVMSDTSLQTLGREKPSYNRSIGRRNGTQTPGPTLSFQRGETTTTTAASTRQDTEWMLQAGLALATSTREEKGQSWLAKRESSTSLVSEADRDEIKPRRGRRSGTSRSQSGASTPATMSSRQGSRSRRGSRGPSKIDLSMTAIDNAELPANGSRSRPSEESIRSIEPDFVDESVRAEMARYQEVELDGDESSSLLFDSDSEPDDDLDEAEFQRLTRERGFGLGRWVDRFIERTLFGIAEEEPSTSQQAVVAPTAVPSQEAQPVSKPGMTNEAQDGGDSSGDEAIDDVPDRPIEKAGDQGGWADAGWLLRLATRAIL
ncbi:hypothetical protein VTN31DRAFT_2193 [Thermomyces dupontii]|uniref:uncharacterized protein n=1 Tax=Talaromyces thermophilus TaxID=28565 RepID=UPI0037428110